MLARWKRRSATDSTIEETIKKQKIDAHPHPFGNNEMTGIMIQNDPLPPKSASVGEQRLITYTPPLLLTYKEPRRNVSVRQATCADFLSIKMIENEPPTVGDVFTDELLCFLIPSTYVATDESNKVVGFIIAHTLGRAVLKRVQRAFTKPFVPRKGARFRNILNIVNIKVLGSYQKQGIGKQLVFQIIGGNPHKFVTYETPFAGRHVIESCCLFLKYKKLPPLGMTRSYMNGDPAYCIGFERVEITPALPSL